jgi:ATP-dependent RNA helicase DDX52/ROK1
MLALLAMKRPILIWASVRYLVLDEADRLLDKEFLEQTQEIVASCTHTRLQKAVFSATLPAGVEKIAMDMLQDPIRLVVGLKSVTRVPFSFIS